MIRILHTADSHIGVDLPARPRRNGPRRGDDIVNSYECVLRVARQHAVDLVIHAGDLFDGPCPTAGALMAATRPLRALADAGIPVVIVPGNHDRSALREAVLLNHRAIHVLDAPRTVAFDVRGVRIAVSGFACIRRDAAARFEGALAATNWGACGCDLRVLAVHQAFDSAVCGANDYRFRSSKDVVERSAVPDAFDYVAAGHVHRYQRLRPARRLRPEIVYAGAPDRITFAERNEPKGAVLVEFDGAALRHRFIEHAVRPMTIVPLAVTGLSTKEMMDEIEREATALPPNTVAQIRLTGVAAPAALRRLRIADNLRRRRPDALISVTVRGLERVESSVADRNSKDAASLAPSIGVGAGHRVAIDAVARLPDRPGVYAFFDEQDRVLYVGKATNLRSRVRSHLNSPEKGNFFAGWTKQAARVEAKVLPDEAEALRVEQKLIERWCPPYNIAGRAFSRRVSHSATPASANHQTPSAEREDCLFRQVAAKSTDTVAHHSGSR